MEKTGPKNLNCELQKSILHSEQINKCLIVEGRSIMKKNYKIEVDCANCANLMEGATKKVPGVADAAVNFMTQKLSVEFAEGADPEAVMKEVLKACKKVEPDCEIIL
jgi:copper chaperone CopZ